MTNVSPPDSEIAAEIAKYPTRSLADALDEMVTSYLCFEGEGRADENKYRHRKSAYYQSYYPFTHKASWWNRLFWKIKKVDHPQFPEKSSLEKAARFFIWMGRQRLHTKLLNGEAKAFGYSMPRKPQDLPVPVPPDVWGEDMSAAGIDWDESTVKGHGLRFCAIQIVFAEEYEWADIKTIEQPAAPTVLTDKEVKKKKPGRPSHAKAIQEAIRTLFNYGKISSANSDLSQVEIVRAQVNIDLKLPPDNTKNLREDVITDHLREFFRPFRSDKSSDK